MVGGEAHVGRGEEDRREQVGRSDERGGGVRNK